MRRVLLGALCGAAWGVAARVWMRLIATDPEFTWSGSLAIVGVAAIAGLGMGAVWALGRWRGIGGVAMAPLFLGPGMLMVPTVALGALALRWRAGRPRLATVSAALAAASAGLLVGTALLDELSGVRAALCFLLYLGLTAWLAAMLAVILRPVRTIAPDRATSTGQNGGQHSSAAAQASMRTMPSVEPTQW